MKPARGSKTASVDFAVLARSTFLLRCLLFNFTQLLVMPLFLLIDGLVQPVEEPALFLGVGCLSHV